MKRLLTETAERALSFLEELPERTVAPPVDVDALRAAMGGNLPETGEPPERVLAALDVGPRGVHTAAAEDRVVVVVVDDGSAGIDAAHGVGGDLGWRARHIGVAGLGRTAVECGFDDQRVRHCR